MDEETYSEEQGWHKCPTCGRFVSLEDGYYDLPPGGHFDCDYIVPYCDESCANRKSPPCIHEDEDEEEESYRDLSYRLDRENR